MANNTCQHCCPHPAITFVKARNVAKCSHCGYEWGEIKLRLPLPLPYVQPNPIGPPPWQPYGNQTSTPEPPKFGEVICLPSGQTLLRRN
jgi:hypothetical protein